jgi:Mn2+/Fe2+ NRAMP family transporter
MVGADFTFDSPVDSAFHLGQLSFLNPLPMIPLIIYTRKVMGEFVNRSITNILAFIFAIIIIGLNAYLIVTSL